MIPGLQNGLAPRDEDLPVPDDRPQHEVVRHRLNCLLNRAPDERALRRQLHLDDLSTIALNERDLLDTAHASVPQDFLDDFPARVDRGVDAAAREDRLVHVAMDHGQHPTGPEVAAQGRCEEVSLVRREGRDHEVGVRHPLPAQKLWVCRVVLEDECVRQLLSQGVSPVGVFLDEARLKAALFKHPGRLVPDLAPAQNHDPACRLHTGLWGQGACELLNLARPPNYQQANAGPEAGGPPYNLHVLVVEHRHEVDPIGEAKVLHGFPGDRARLRHSEFGHDDPALPEMLDVAGGGEAHDLDNVTGREVVGPHHEIDVESFSKLRPGGKILCFGHTGDGEGAPVHRAGRAADQNVAPVVARAPNHQIGVLYLRGFEHVHPCPIALVGKHIGFRPDFLEAIGVLVNRDHFVLPSQRVGHAATNLSDADDDDLHEMREGPS